MIALKYFSNNKNSMLLNKGSYNVAYSDWNGLRVFSDIRAYLLSEYRRTFAYLQMVSGVAMD